MPRQGLRISSLCCAVAALGLAPLGFFGVAQDIKSRRLPPFLEDFKRNNRPEPRTRTITLPSALGPVTGFLTRPDTKEQLPAVLLIHDEAGLTDWMKQNAREMSGIGYVVLALDLADHVPKKQAERESFRENERVLAKLSAAVRWLRRQNDVLPDRIGVVGWSWGAGQALALAASVRVQACVLCYGPVTDAPAVLAGLERTAVLGIFAEAGTPHKIAGFREALAKNRIPHKIVTPAGVMPGFMGPPGRTAYVEQQAEDAWVEIYEFLGKHVEDADVKQPLAPWQPRLSAVATIADIMRAANNPTGLRGRLIQSLEIEPAGVQQWRQVRADAALLTEAASLLQRLQPPRGSSTDWNKQAQGFQKVAAEIVTAADRRDYKSARRALEDLGNRCSACHKKHR